MGVANLECFECFPRGSFLQGHYEGKASASKHRNPVGPVVREDYPKNGPSAKGLFGGICLLCGHLKSVVSSYVVSKEGASLLRVDFPESFDGLERGQ